jgi:predicted membrane protein
MEARSLFGGQGANRRVVMPVLIMWAVPAVIVIGGVGYLLVHMH